MLTLIAQIEIRIYIKANAAVLISESVAAERLWFEIEELLADDKRKAIMHDALLTLARPKASTEIATQITTLCHKVHN